MSNRKLHAISFLAVLGTGMAGSVPAYACHLATGWCCTEVGTSYYCCYWNDNVLKAGSCGWLQPT